MHGISNLCYVVLLFVVVLCAVWDHSMISVQHSLEAIIHHTVECMVGVADLLYIVLMGISLEVSFTELSHTLGLEGLL